MRSMMVKKENFKRLTVLVDPELFRDIKITAAVRNLTMSHYVQKILLRAMEVEKNPFNRPELSSLKATSEDFY